MMRRACMGGLLGILLLGLFSQRALAIPKVIVHVGVPFWCTVAEVEEKSGTQVCVRLDIYPWTQFPVALTEHAARTASVLALASASCDALKTLVINRMAVEFPTVSIVAEDVWMHACTQ